MTKLFPLFFVLLATFAPVCAVNGRALDPLAGTWMVDVTASERSFLQARPFKDETAFTVMPPMGLMFHQFEGDKLTVGALPSEGGNVLQYRRVSRAGAVTNYKSVTGSEDDTITVRPLNNNNISVTYPAFPETRFFVWKRVTLDSKKREPDDYKPEFDAYMGMMMKLFKAFGFGR